MKPIAIDAERNTDSQAALPIPMVMFCPSCGEQHIDAAEPPSEANPQGWDNPPHRTHKCKACQYEWRHCDVPTTGVAMTASQGQNEGRPLAKAAPATGQALFGLRKAVYDTQQLRASACNAWCKVDPVSLRGSATAIEAEEELKAAINNLALLLGLPPTDLAD